MPSTIDNYTCTKTLGSGISAKVKLATTPDGTRVALKVFDKTNPHNSATALSTLQKEVEVYKNLNHPYMVKLLAFKENAIWKKSDGTQKAVAYMALELCTGGELFDFVALGNFSPEVCRYYFKQMLQVMHYIHVKGIAHRDLKPENIMLDDQFNVKIADFGFAAPIQGRDGSGFLRSLLGTQAYMAPEILLKEPYQGHVVDLFALGIILFILYSGHPPFSNAHPNDPHYKLIATNRADLFWKTHSNKKPADFFTADFRDLITNMLQPLANQRLSIADIIGHPWMQGATATEAQVKLDFANRNKSIKSQQAADAAQKAAMRQTHNTARQGVRRGENIGGQVYMSDNADTTTEESKENVVHLKLANFEPVIHRNTVMYSTYEPEFIFAQLTSKLQDKDITPEMDQKKWKMKFNMMREQTEEEINQVGQQNEGCRIQVKLLKLENEKVCIEFMRLEGSAWLFLEQFKQLQDELQYLNDVAHEIIPEITV